MRKLGRDVGQGQSFRALLIAAIVVPGLGACSLLPKPDYSAALLAPCENTADKYPWELTDGWDSGDSYMPQTQFRPDGVVAYTYENATFENGRWALDGADLSIDMNNHYSDYTGTFNGETAKGTMKNQVGNTGKWSLKRACKT